MKKVVFCIFTTVMVGFWTTYPPTRVQSHENNPTLNATKQDSVESLKADIVVKIAETELVLISIIKDRP